VFGVIKSWVGLTPRAAGSQRGEYQPASTLRPVGRDIPEKRGLEECSNLKGRLDVIIGRDVSSGVNVNETTALSVSAVTACVGLLADMIAKLPIYLYQDTPEGPIEISDHPAFSVVSKMPSDLHTPFELRQLMETGKGLGGNGYARVFRDGGGDPISLQWLEPCYVSPRLVKRPNGERFVAYYVEGETMPLTRYDILHVRGFSKDGVCGLSPIRLLRESIGTALAQTEAAGRLMRDGTQFPGFLVAQQSLKADVLADARDEFQRNYGGPQNAGKVPVLNGNFDFKQTNGMSMVDAQFIESRRFELQEIARLYRIPAFMVGDTTASTTWGSGIEQQTLGFLNFSLDPHLVSWEQSLGHTLLTTEEMRKGYYFRFDRDQLANVALEARANFFQTMRNIGVFSPNDIRAKLEEPLISAEEGGDSYGMPLASNAGAAPIPQPQEV
jgi:HK97 family phage portal protein